MKKTILILIIISVLSCRKDFYYDFDHIPQVNVSCFLKAGDTVRVRLSYLVGDTLFGTILADKDYISKADVYLYEDNIFQEKLTYKEIPQINFVEKGWYYSQYFIPTEKHHYNLKIHVPDYDTVYAETYIPEAIPIDSIQINGEALKDSIIFDRNLASSVPDGILDFSVNIFFKDKSGTTNYYDFWSNKFFISYDPAIEPRYNREYYENISLAALKIAFFSDEIFDGHTYAINTKFKIDDYKFDYISEFPIKLGLNSLSYDAYAFYKSSYLYLKSLDNPFTEPVIIYSNVKNGTGVFAGISSVEDSFLIVPSQN
ncbi:MAG: DUF4249 domain-containing protein [Bacteroidetes bacterium]|nr:DUF4249 domain-containing protein [Bacteroidota bacterium]